MDRTGRSEMRRLATALLLLATPAALAQPSPPPILDMHLHASSLDGFARLLGPPPIPHCVPMTDYPVPASGAAWAEVVRSRDLPCRATWSPTDDEELMTRTLEIMERRNVFGVTSGERLGRWMEVAAERIVPSAMLGGGPDAPSLEMLRAGFEAGRFEVLGEVAVQYGGLAADDPGMAPYWALAEELDIPVGIHIGTGPVGAPYLGFSAYRASLHSPLALEEVLLRHPRLRVYVMHAGWPMLDDLLALLWTHPQVHVDLGVIDWALPRAEFHRYLRRIVEAGFGKRVLFGSDQMVWPETLEMAIDSIESAEFLDAGQKRDILFDNAARFLRLSPERIAAMHGEPAGDIGGGAEHQP